MGSWDWTYFFATGTSDLDAPSTVDFIAGHDEFLRFDGTAVGLRHLEDSDGEREYLDPLDLGANPTAAVRQLLNDGKSFATEYYRREGFPITIAFGVGQKHPNIREHIAIGWLSRALRRMDSQQIDAFGCYRQELMALCEASYAITVSDPPDELEDRLINIDGRELFDNNNWRSEPYEILSTWVNEATGLTLPDGIPFQNRRSIGGGLVEYT